MKVLVVEDNPISRKLTRLTLETEGFTVIEAANGQTAIDVVTRDCPDLILQDLLLPDLDGFDLVQRLHELTGAGKVPILALTGLIAAGDEKKLPLAPFADYLFKPVEPSFLASTVRGHLAASQTSESVPGRGKIILAVDDDAKQLKLLATYLANLGFGVTTAKDGAEALAKAETTLPDAIISDVLMPNVDGFELCRSIRKHERLSKTPIVLLTNNYGEEADRRLAAASGANALIQRTPDCKEAVEILLQSLNQSSPSPAPDDERFEAGHKESVMRQLNRQARLSVDLARRCAAQSAQISVLASAAQSFLKPSQSIESLLSEILAHYLTVIGFSRGAVYLVNETSELKLAGQIGFPEARESALADFFGSRDWLHEIMACEEPTVLTTPAADERFQTLLSRASVRSIIGAPLAFDDRPLGVIALFSETRELYPEWTHFSKLIHGQISQAVALWQTISQLKYLADYDPLTGLANRAQLTERLRRLLGEQKKPVEAALLRVNVDGFEEINNALSYSNGDELLRQLGRRLQETLPQAEMIARLEGDEFGIIVAQKGVAEASTAIAREIRDALKAPFVIGRLPLDVHVSIGIAIAPMHATDAENLLRRADMAMRAAKRSTAGYMLYGPAIDLYDPQRLTLMGELRYAIEHDELSLFYQPKVNIRTGRAVGVEALVRWRHPERGMVMPDQFIPLAEKTGAIQHLTEWVLQHAVSQTAAWRRAGIDIAMSVNLSARNLLEPAFPERIMAIVNKTEIPPGKLVMEITESALMADPAKAREVLQALSQQAIRFSIDDFGTGYSSFAYLKHLPVSEIKIDKLFVFSLIKDPDSASIVRAIIDLGKNLGMSVVAEGVEDQHVWDELAALGCDQAQGYFLSRPQPSSEMELWLRESKWAAASEIFSLSERSAAL